MSWYPGKYAKKAWQKTKEGVSEAYVGTKAWAGRHPALTGAVAGGIAGTTLFPGVGTIAGIAAGAGIGATVGGDERNEEDQEREEIEWSQKQAEEAAKAKESEDYDVKTPPSGGGVY